MIHKSNFTYQLVLTCAIFTEDGWDCTPPARCDPSPHSLFASRVAQLAIHPPSTLPHWAVSSGNGGARANATVASLNGKVVGDSCTSGRGKWQKGVWVSGRIT